MAKILNISLEDSLYQQVVDKANDEDRSVRKMVAILVQRGLNLPMQPQFTPTQEQDDLIDRLYNKSMSEYEKREEVLARPEVVVLTQRIDEISDTLDNMTSGAESKGLLEELRETQDKKNKLIRDLMADSE